LLLDPGYSVRRLFDAACRRGWAGCGSHSIASANRPLQIANRTHNTWTQAGARASYNSMGQAPPTPSLRGYFLRNVGRVHAYNPSDYAS
jgi:hypothetical protein